MSCFTPVRPELPLTFLRLLFPPTWFLAIGPAEVRLFPDRLAADLREACVKTGPSTLYRKRRQHRVANLGPGY